MVFRYGISNVHARGFQDVRACSNEIILSAFYWTIFDRTLTVRTTGNAYSDGGGGVPIGRRLRTDSVNLSVAGGTVGSEVNFVSISPWTTVAGRVPANNDNLLANRYDAARAEFFFTKLFVRRVVDYGYSTRGLSSL